MIDKVILCQLAGIGKVGNLPWSIMVGGFPTPVPKESSISKTAMAERMKTSRRQLDRLLNPQVPNITLATMSKAARAVGRELHIALV